MDRKAALRLSVLAEDTLAVALDYSRRQKTSPSAGQSADATLSKLRSNLTTLRGGIQRLESQLSAAEDGAIPPGQQQPATAEELRADEDTLIHLRKDYDAIEALVDAPSSLPSGDVKRTQLFDKTVEQIKQQHQVPKAVQTALIDVIDDPLSVNSVSIDMNDDTDVEREDPLAGVSNRHLLRIQQRVMEVQDSHLDELSSSVRRQRYMGETIHDELTGHIQLLEETEEITERVSGNLQRAQTGLNQFMNRPKKSTWYMVGIILALIWILVIVTKKAASSDGGNGGTPGTPEKQKPQPEPKPDPETPDAGGDLPKDGDDNSDNSDNSDNNDSGDSKNDDNNDKNDGNDSNGEETLSGSHNLASSPLF
ncbi:hypothetical protein GQ42DRAFT_16750 [Ramicandelaber brevisporus]|nr:hypothetical protein GQ42DRAFT_16750 [Ramicandelaber brevisporus]